MITPATITLMVNPRCWIEGRRCNWDVMLGGNQRHIYSFFHKQKCHINILSGLYVLIDVIHLTISIDNNNLSKMSISTTIVKDETTSGMVLDFYNIVLKTISMNIQMIFKSNNGTRSQVISQSIISSIFFVST